MKLIFQVGHLNIEQLTNEGLRSWRDVASLKKSTGASGERNYFSTLIVPELKKKLEAQGFEIVVCNAIYSKEVTQKADLWISFHYDGGGEENRAMISSPLRNANYLNSKAHDSADKFCEIWRELYPSMTGTINRNERITAGMLEFYAYDYVDMNTPAVIIEHFNHTSPKGAELKQDYMKVVNADYLAIMKYFGLEAPVSEHFSIETDIPSSVEEKYKLKDYKDYDNHWTFGQLIEDWCDKSKKKVLYEKEIDLLKLASTEGKKITDKQIQDLKTEVEVQKEAVKKALEGKEYTIEQLVFLIWNKIKGQKVNV